MRGKAKKKRRSALERKEGVALLQEPVDGLREDGEHALVGFEGVVEIDDRTGTSLSFDLREHLLRRACGFIIACEDIPVDEAVAELVNSASLAESGFAVRGSKKTATRIEYRPLR